MPEGSHLTIDETQLQAGVLNSTGVGNARLLKTLAEIQKVLSAVDKACDSVFVSFPNWKTFFSTYCFA